MTEIELYSRFRFSDKLQMEVATQIGQSNDEIGYVYNDNDQIYFGNRKVKFM